MVVSRELVLKEFTRILDIRYMCYLLQLLVNDWMHIPELLSSVQSFCTFVTYFRKSYKASAALKQAGDRSKIKAFSKTRWVGCQISIDSLLRNELELRRLSCEQVEFNLSLPNNIKELLDSHSFWNRLRSFDKLLSPIKTLMDFMEAEDAVLVDVFANWIVIACNLHSLKGEFSGAVYNALIEGFNKRFREVMDVENGIGLLSYFIHPRYHKKGLRGSFARELLYLLSDLRSMVELPDI